jgi:hypothetical protein
MGYSCGQKNGWDRWWDNPAWQAGWALLPNFQCFIGEARMTVLWTP